ncbi:unnamed protein product [Mesocestoides corti]|uniref:Copper transport protein ATOX1 n=1 Tax=Mesocestoides corti TaxID=53468 RepID=A0A0R3U1D3_MESCO|nr:unnamed protein product [Mesocestoides corti]
MTQLHTYNFEMEMSCEGCANAAKRVLAKLGDAVLSVHIDVENNSLVVTSTLPEETILEALQKTSKPVRPVN